MRREVAIEAAGVAPAVQPILRLLDMPEASGRTADLIERAIAIVREGARPRGILADLSRERFAAVFAGEGRNAPRTPLGTIIGRADCLALFAVTLGDAVSREIARLFARSDPALACVLDAAASEAAERAAGVVQAEFAGSLEATPDIECLRYSPGYCGWDVTGQRALFAELRPEEIGIRLRESCLMEPLKSVSGVIVAGPAEIHEIGEEYPFCADCATKSCRERSHRAASS